jgi:multidrug transporter EmrE-like cation transporter
MQQAKVVLLVVAYVAVSCFANIGYKLSTSGGMKNLLIWQIVANTVGFFGVVTLTWLYKLIPMHLAYPLTQALVILSIQVIAARLIFKEQITWTQWAGTSLIVLGIILVTARART